MQYSVIDLVGNVGVVLILLAYLLLQTGRIEHTALKYSVLNGLGAALVLISLAFDFNLSAFLIESFWLLISLYGVYTYATSRGDGLPPTE